MRVLMNQQWGGLGIDWLWEPRDVWWGVYWCTRWDWDGHSPDAARHLHVYICLLPLLPLRVRLSLPALSVRVQQHLAQWHEHGHVPPGKGQDHEAR